MNFSRSVPLIGEDGLARLAACRVTVVGLGGVGGYVVEVLARSGVGTLTLIDGDKVEESNLNRQIAALRSTIGAYKAKALAERVKGINPHCKVEAVCEMLNAQNCERLIVGSSYVADAIDSLDAKADLAVFCTSRGVPIVSAMGAGNRAGWCDFCITDIFKTEYDPLAKKFRKTMKERGVSKLDVCFTRTSPAQTGGVVASMPFAPAACGVRMGAHIIEKLLDRRD